MSGDRIQHVQIRQPATANLMVDSADRTTTGSADNFTIQKKNSILNGFFHRIATTEVVLDWNVPNIQAAVGNNKFTLQSGTNAPYTVTLVDGFYTVSEALNIIVDTLNLASATVGDTFVLQVNPPALISVGLINFTITQTPLSTALSFQTGLSQPAYKITSPDLRLYKYIDFLSSQLTYNQKLKDATTSSLDNNVLCRWYFAWDESPVLDASGMFPVLQGYTNFVQRRLFNPPKEIRWENNMPVGQLAFQLVNDKGALLSSSVPLTYQSESLLEWQMTLQVSED